MRSYRGRFAPSPTGDLHLGSAAAAVLCAAAALRAGGTLVMRVEDLDPARCRPDVSNRMLDELRWLGLSWQEGPDVAGPTAPYVQSKRSPLYEAALELLIAQGLVYRCDCSRAEIQRAVGAPHAEDEGPRYSGQCRPYGMRDRAFRRPPALRLAVPEGMIARVHDEVLGTWESEVAEHGGDFVLRRGDGAYCYQLAVVVDDLAMGITEVVRGSDLASSAPRQVLLATLLGGEAPRFAHLPLVVGAGGERLAKRSRGVPISEQRAAGRDPDDLVRAIAVAYGQDIGDSEAPWPALARRFEWSRVPREPVSVSVLTASV